MNSTAQEGRLLSAPVIRVLRSAGPVWPRLLLAGFLGALAIGSSVGLIAASAFLISKASQQPPILHLGVAIVSVRAFGIGRGVFRYAERLTGHDAAFRSLTDLRLAVYERLAIVAPAGSGAYRSGDLLNRLVADVDSVVDLYLRVALPYLIAAAVSVGAVVLISLFVPAAAVALALALLVGAVVVPFITLKALDRSQERVAPAMARLTAETVTLVDGAAEITALGQQRRFIDRIAATDRELTDAAAKAAKSQGLGSALGVLAQGAAIVAAVVFGTQAVTSGQLDGLNLAMVVLVPLAAYEAVQVLPAAVITLARVRESARRVVAVLDSPDLVPDPPVSADRTTAVTATLAGGAPLQITGLRAGWQPGQWLVGPLDLCLAPGAPVALTGPSGSGKSTVAAALTRLAPAAGQLDFAGMNLAGLAGEEVRRIIGLAEQQPHLFDTSIAENIRLARRDASDEEITKVLTDIGLGEWLAGLPQGVNTPVGRFGRAISGGQRQRIGLARVLIADFPVVIADEPTEYLDDENAELAMTTLLRHCRDRALLVISHREADVRRCDHVIRI